MTFLHTGLLAAGVAAISIPIIIHLLMRRRRKPVRWGAMRFLLEAYKRTRRRLLIERWLLLAARCVLVALIAIAIGRPIVGALVGERVGGRTVYILLDNSLASSATDAAGATALSKHVAAARATLESLGEGDRAGLVLLGAPAQRLVLPATANIGALGQVLQQVAPTDARADIPAALAAVASTIVEARSRGSQLDAPDRTFVLLLSDLYRGSADIETTIPRLPPGVRLLAARTAAAATGSAGSAPGNVSIQSASPMRSIMLADQLDQAQTITVNLRRSGSAHGAEMSQVTLRLEGPAGGPAAATHAGRAAVSWSAGQREATTTVVLDAAGALGSAGSASRTGEARARQPGVIQATIDRDAVAGDNTFRVPVDVRETLRVGIIGSPGSRSARAGDPEALQGSDWVALALRPREDVAVEVTDLEPGVLDSSRLAGLDAIVITAPDRVADSDWARLRQFAESGSPSAAGAGASSAGGMLIVTPPGDRSVHTWTDAMTRGLGLSWSIAREAKTYDPASPDRPRVVAGDVPAGASLLAPLRAELGDLARSVNMFRVLPVVGRAEGGVAELALSDGTGLVWVGQVAAATAEAKRPGAAGEPAEAEAPAGASAPARARGVFVYIACSLDLKWSDLPVKPLMVPLVQELVRQGVGRSRPSSSALAGHVVTTPPQTARLRAWKENDAGGKDDAGQVVTVDEWGNTAKPMRHAGVWDAIDAGGGRRGVVVVNADPAAGDLSTHEQAGLEAWLGKALQSGQLAWVAPGETAGGASAIKTALAARNQGRPTSAILLAAALLLALVEMMLARWASH